VKQQVGVRIDETGEERHSRELDDTRAGRTHVAGGTDRRNAIAPNQHDPTFSGLRGDAVEDARRAEQNGRSRSPRVSALS
jgi:hypothetical protein